MNSYGDDPERFGDENVVFLAHAHNGQEVWFVMTKERPQADDFDRADTPELRPALEESVRLQSHYAKLLNMHDGGKRIEFENAAAWLDRLRALKEVSAGEPKPPDGGQPKGELDAEKEKQAH